MNIRVTTWTPPKFVSILPKLLVKRSRGRLLDFPWLYVGDVEGDWSELKPEAYAKAVVDSPTNEVVLDFEHALTYRDASGSIQHSYAGLGSWVDNKQLTISTLERIGKVVEACAATGKRIWSYPCWPLPLGIALDSHARDDAYDEMTKTEWVNSGRHLVGGMLPCYPQHDMNDWRRTVDVQLQLCAMYGIRPRMILGSASYQAIESQGWPASFIGRKNVLDQAAAVKDLGLELGFFNPNYPPALEAICDAALTL